MVTCRAPWTHPGVASLADPLFACGRKRVRKIHKAKLVIEADGPVHHFKKEYDKNRDEVLRSLNLTILRFENDQIIKDTQAVLNAITVYLK